MQNNLVMHSMIKKTNNIYAPIYLFADKHIQACYEWYLPVKSPEVMKNGMPPSDIIV